MISYWKNYWINFVACIFHILLCFHFLATEQDLAGVLQLFLAIYWIGSSFIAYNSSNIQELNKRLKKVEEHAITDLDPDGKGNYTLGVKEQIIFPEIDIDKITKIFGMEITFVTSANTDEEAYALLREFGLPFKNAKKNQ